VFVSEFQNDVSHVGGWKVGRGIFNGLSGKKNENLNSIYKIKTPGNIKSKFIPKQVSSKAIQVD